MHYLFPFPFETLLPDPLAISINQPTFSSSSLPAVLGSQFSCGRSCTRTSIFELRCSLQRSSPCPPVCISLRISCAFSRPISERLSQIAGSDLMSRNDSIKVSSAFFPWAIWNWRKKYHAGYRSPAAVPFLRLPTASTPDTSLFEIEFANNTRLKVPTGFDADSLRMFISVLW
jgi:hypothetical protein